MPLQKLHLATLVFRFRCSWLRRIHLVYHMCISWQWPAWAVWIATLPFLIYTGHWFGVFGIAVGACLYVFPAFLWAVVSVTLASIETRHTYPGRVTSATFLRRFGRLVPYLVINTGMLAHQLSAFTEGLFGPLRGEFERTPKAGSVAAGSIDAAPREGSGAAARLS